MRTRIKFCGLVRPEDVDAAVRVGADAIGFVFYGPSPRYLDPAEAKALRQRLPSFVRAVGLFVNAPLDEIRRCRETVGLDLIQFHGDEAPALTDALGGPFWKAHRVVPGYPLGAEMARHGRAEFHLLDSRSAGYGGSGQTFDWAVADGVDPARLIVSGGIAADNVGAAIARIGPFAVDTSTGIEGESARIKDVSRMEAFVAAVRAADGLRAARVTGP